MVCQEETPVMANENGIFPGAAGLAEQNIVSIICVDGGGNPALALGRFDVLIGAWIHTPVNLKICQKMELYQKVSREKDQTDLELALTSRSIPEFSWATGRCDKPVCRRR
jgi:thiamine pyrophosphokinase